MKEESLNTSNLETGLLSSTYENKNCMIKASELHTNISNINHAQNENTSNATDECSHKQVELKDNSSKKNEQAMSLDCKLYYLYKKSISPKYWK